MTLDVLTDEEKKEIINGLASVAHVFIPTYDEQRTAELVDDAIALARARVAAGEWSVELAQLHIGIANDAAVASYASARNIQVDQVRRTLNSILGVIATAVNNRIGFNLLPVL